ncbi:right-handed parallel beta-helix repeat-containing protein [Collimonas arenae]|nr:right-handed parallel beta-helix repeat-containing protein [Collimonas arenae]
MRNRVSKWLLMALVVATGLTLPAVHATADGIIQINPGRADKPGFLVIIEYPGQYQLSGNLRVPDANTTAVEINADNVTLDLNGYTIQGPARCVKPMASCTPAGGGNGVHTVNRRNVMVRNGNIQGMGNYGVYLETSSGRIERLVLTGNANGGAVFFGGSISDSIAEANGGDGIFGVDLKVRRNVIRNNFGYGLKAFGKSASRNNEFIGNNGNAVQSNLKSAVGDGNTCSATACR